MLYFAFASSQPTRTCSRKEQGWFWHRAPVSKTAKPASFALPIPLIRLKAGSMKVVSARRAPNVTATILLLLANVPPTGVQLRPLV